MSDRKFKCAVYIGRFQPFHNAHLKTVMKALEIADSVIIAIGSYKRPRSIKNPWTSEERTNFIRESLMEAKGIKHTFEDKLNEIEKRVKFIHIRDYMYNNTRWAAEVYSKATTIKGIFSATQDKTTCLIGHFKDDTSFYLNMFPQWELIPVPNYNNINGTDIREDMFVNGKLSKKSIDKLPPCITRVLSIYKTAENAVDLGEEYRFWIEYEKRHRYYDPKINYRAIGVCADAIVIKSGHVLMIKRKFNPGKGLWALPGGHVNDNETFEQAALRELKEETRIKVDKIILKKSIKDSKIFDHPKRSMGARKITNAFLINLGFGFMPNVKAKDDADEVRWIPIADLYEYEDKMFDDHSDIIKQMISKY